MKKVRWSDWQAKRASFSRARAKLSFEKQSSSRVRDKEERKLLLQLDQARLDSWKREGKLQVIGSRKVQFKI